VLQVCHEVDGYKIRLVKSDAGEYPKYKAEARDDLWGKYGEAYAETSYDALCKLSERMEIDRDEVLITFGVQS